MPNGPSRANAMADRPHSSTPRRRLTAAVLTP
jgi:hypothetical protein